MSNPTDTNQASEADKAVMIGFLYGIQSDFLPADEVRHRMAGFRHTQGYKEAIGIIRTEKLKLLAEVREAHRDGYMRGVSDFSGYFMDASNVAQRNPIMPEIAIELREAYRAPILSTKLEAEL